jgi:hypothetical protein
LVVERWALNDSETRMLRAYARSQGLLRLGLVLAGLWVGRGDAVGAEEERWQVCKSQHFLVQYTVDEAEARAVSTVAERYYEAIADDLGFTRYHDFWLWDRRVKILIYPSAEAFAAACQAPAWAAGKADTQRREIAGYHHGGAGFVEGVLPHEMAHLILNDFVGTDRLPLWVTEGYAQWVQFGRKPVRFDQDGVGSRRLPFAEWVNFDVRRERDSGLARRYYHQSASVVGFLIAAFGGERFGRFCRALRDGKIMDKALETAYADQVPSLARLEASWIKYLEGVKP